MRSSPGGRAVAPAQTAAAHSGPGLKLAGARGNPRSSEQAIDLNLIVSLYLDFAELQTHGKWPMTMRDWIAILMCRPEIGRLCFDFVADLRFLSWWVGADPRSCATGLYENITGSGAGTDSGTMATTTRPRAPRRARIAANASICTGLAR